jgi:hypothetical protein
LSTSERREIDLWTESLATHTPEIVEMARGWAAGATAAGVPMSETHALAIWTGYSGPASEIVGLGYEDAMSNARQAAALRGVASYNYAGTGAPPEPCSGCCAWGQATSGGQMVVGASTDHDCTFQVTILAYPDDGYDFVYTPFSVNGTIPVFGELFMAGHPGLNSAGLTYVHHGGVPYVGEAPDEWGYGVRRGAGTFHLLRYAGSAKEALEIQKSWPVGDAGRAMGTDGGFFADDEYAYVLESRTGGPDGGPVVRDHTVDADGREYSFLYANNNSISPQAPQVNAVPAGVYEFDPIAGWFTRTPGDESDGGHGAWWRRACTKSSESRNRFQFKAMLEGYGEIDAAYMERLYATSGKVPGNSWEEAAEEFNDGGQWEGAVGQRMNAFVSIVEPRSGTYTGCVGPLGRGLATHSPSHGFYYYDETGTSWELKLARSPEEAVVAARSRAEADSAAAEGRLAEAGELDDEVKVSLGGWLKTARSEREAGGREQGEMDAGEEPGTRAARWARALRHFTTAQVRARQVSEALAPLPPLPLDR